MDEVALRACRDPDVEEAVRVWARSRWDVQPWLEERMGHTPEDDLTHFREVILRDCEVQLAWEGDAIVGLIAHRAGRVEQLYVEPSCQGRGIGTALLAWARERSPSGLSLFTHQRNARARAFYEARGFEAVEFGRSPPPEDEPDVRYVWAPDAGRSNSRTR